MEYIKTYYTKEAYDKAEKKEPNVSFIMETGKVEYNNKQNYNNDFNEDFDLLDPSQFEEKFNFYK
jgi:hypothetical protein